MTEIQSKPRSKCLWWFQPSRPQLRRARKIRKILDCLAENDDLSYREIAERTDIPKSTVRDCLKVVRSGKGLRLVAGEEPFPDDVVGHGCEPTEVIQ